MTTMQFKIWWNDFQRSKIQADKLAHVTFAGGDTKGQKCEVSKCDLLELALRHFDTSHTRTFDWGHPNSSSTWQDVIECTAFFNLPRGTVSQPYIRIGFSTWQSGQRAFEFHLPRGRASHQLIRPHQFSWSNATEWVASQLFITTCG